MGLRALYSDVVDIRKPSISQGATGVPVCLWQTIDANRLGRLRRISNAEKISRGIESNVAAFVFYCDPNTKVDSSCEIWNGNEQYKVVDIEESMTATAIHHQQVYCTKITTTKYSSPSAVSV